MKEEDFVSKRTGKLEWENNGLYYRFEPNSLPFKGFDITLDIQKQTFKTIFALGKVQKAMEDFNEKEIDLLQTPFILKESTLSSEIEGTRSTITDIYMEEKVIEKNIEKRLDNQEVRNYRDALNYALNSDEEISEKFIKTLHKKLLDGVRGEDKLPGEYKIDQNGIGKRRDTLDIAKFVPASPQKTPYLMENLVDFINNGQVLNLYKIAITHYQFESIHPFRDGNGRLGRLLITLQLCREKIISKPLIYVSEFFATNRDAYIDSLYETSAKGNIEEFVKFILKAIETQANHALNLLEKLEKYKIDIELKMKNISKSVHNHELMNYLVIHPFFTIKDIQTILNISQPASLNLVKKLLINDIVFESPHKEGKSKVYFMHGWLKIIDNYSRSKNI